MRTIIVDIEEMIEVRESHDISCYEVDDGSLEQFQDLLEQVDKQIAPHNLEIVLLDNTDSDGHSDILSWYVAKKNRLER